MTLLTTLAPSSAPQTSPLARPGGAAHGRVPDPAVPAVERTRGIRDALQDQAQPAQERSKGGQRPGVQDRETQRPGARNSILRRDREGQSRPPAPVLSEPRTARARPRGEGFSAPFLAQVFEQDLGPLQDFIPEHRDAANRGSDAYRQAGAAPPAYSEEPTHFSFAI